MTEITRGTLMMLAARNTIKKKRFYDAVQTILFEVKFQKFLLQESRLNNINDLCAWIQQYLRIMRLKRKQQRIYVHNHWWILHSSSAGVSPIVQLVRCMMRFIRDNANLVSDGLPLATRKTIVHRLFSLFYHPRAIKKCTRYVCSESLLVLSLPMEELFPSVLNLITLESERFSVINGVCQCIFCIAVRCRLPQQATIIWERLGDAAKLDRLLPPHDAVVNMFKDAAPDYHVLLKQCFIHIQEQLKCGTQAFVHFRQQTQTKYWSLPIMRINNEAKIHDCNWLSLILTHHGLPGYTLVTCPFYELLLRDFCSNETRPMYVLSPLVFVLLSDHPQADHCASLLVSHVTTRELNTIDGTGLTPLMAALDFNRKLTLTSIIARLNDIDFSTQFYVGQEDGKVYFAIDMMTTEIANDSKIGPVFITAEKTRKAMAEQTATLIHPLLLHSLPRDLVNLCCEYGLWSTVPTFDNKSVKGFDESVEELNKHAGVKRPAPGKKKKTSKQARKRCKRK